MDDKIKRAGQSRAIVLDVLRCARNVPSFPVERTFDVNEIADARQQASPRISWTALFTRAYGLASREHPQLRQMFVSWPMARVYQSPRCVISVAINRQLDSGERLFFGRLYDPDSRSLVDIQRDLDHYQSGDPARVFLSQWRGAKFPSLVRRLVWWWRMDLDYRNRARRVGTASLSALAGQGVTNRLHPNMLTSSLSFGPVEKDGRCLVTLQCDHRVIDGAAAARALNSIDAFLGSSVLEELRSRASSPQVRAKLAG